MDTQQQAVTLDPSEVSSPALHPDNVQNAVDQGSKIASQIPAPVSLDASEVSGGDQQGPKNPYAAPARPAGLPADVDLPGIARPASPITPFTQAHPVASAFLGDPTTDAAQKVNQGIASEQAGEVEDAEAPAKTAGAAITGLGSGVKNLATGVNALSKPEYDTNQAANGADNAPAVTPQLTQQQTAAAKAQALHGTAQIIANGGTVAMVFGAPEVAGIANEAFGGSLAARVALAKFVGSLAVGAGSSYGAGKVADQFNFTPEAKELLTTSAFFFPSLFGLAAAHETFASLPDGGEGYSATTPGGKYGVGVTQTPEATEIRAGIKGTGSVGVRIPRGRGAPDGPSSQLPGGEGEPVAPPSASTPPPPPPPPPPSAPEVQNNAQIAEVTRLASAARDTKIKAEQVTGSLPPPPPPPKVPSPPGMDDGHLTPEVISQATQAIQAMPPAARPKMVLEAVQSLSRWIHGKGTIIDPDNQVVNVDTPKGAQAAATKIINAQMGAQKEAADAAATEKQDNLQTAQEEREEAIAPTETGKSTESTPAVQIPKSPQVDKARAAIQGAPADATGDHFDQIIRKTAMVTTPVRKALVQEEITRRANALEDQAETGMNGQPAAPGQSRIELQKWADGVKNGEQPFFHVPAKSSFVPKGIDDLKKTTVNGAGAFSGTYYHDEAVSPADIRKAARDKRDPQAALDAIAENWKAAKGEPVELAPEEVAQEGGSEPGLSQSPSEQNQPVASEVAQSAARVPGSGQLPADLAKSTPRYGYRDKNFDVDFEDPTDAAAYVLSMKNGKESAAHQKFLDYYREQWGTTAGLEPHARRVRDVLKKLAKDANPEDGPLKLQSQSGTMPEPAIKLTPEAASGLHQIVEAAKEDDPSASLDSVLSSKGDGKLIAQALVNDGIITNSDTDVNPATALLTTRARTKVGDALLSTVLSPETVEAAPPFVREKLLGAMGSIGSISETSPEWNLKPALAAAVENYGAGFRGEEMPDHGPVVDALVQTLDGSPEDLRKAFQTYAVSASSPGENPNPVLDFNVAFGTELTKEQFEQGIKAEAPVSQLLDGEMKPANNETTSPVAETKPLAKGDKVTYTTTKGKERTGEVAWTDGKKVRITDNGSTVNKGIDDVKPIASPAAQTPETDAADLVDHLQLAFQSGRGPKDYNALKKLVAEFDGTEPTQLRMKEGQEAYEAMLNRVASEIVLKNEGGSRETFDRMVNLYEKQPNLSIRTSTSIDNQAYSTPLPLAFIADRFAGIGKGVSVYEPTAGNGALLIASDQAVTYANEMNPARADMLKAEGFQVSRQDATTFTPPFRTDAVVANPPFGSLDAPIKYDGYSIVKLDHLIAVKALSVMKDNGRATIILGAGNRERAGDVTNAARPFFNYVYSHYNVVSDFELNGDLYARQGASFPVRVIAIDGRARTAKVSPVAEEINRLTSWEEVYAKASEHLGANLQGRPRTDDELSSSSQLRADTESVSRPPAGSPGQGNLGRPSEGEGADASDGGNLEPAKPGIISHSSRVPAPAVGSPDITTRSDGDVALSDRLAEGQSAPRVVRREPAELDGRAGNAVEASALADESNQFQVTYRPRSEKKDVSVMAPKALIDPMHSAMDTISADVGDLDEFVANELGYQSLDEMHAAFMGIQTDAIASAIHQLKQGKALIVADQCVAGETLIYDPIENTHTPISELAERNQPITVLALTPEGMAPVSASSPFRKGVADLFEVATQDGRRITVTSQHRFLSSSGWTTIAQGLSAGDSLATSVSPSDQRNSDFAATHKGDVQRYSQTTSGSKDRYSSCLSQCDEQLLSWSGTDPELSPLRDDARARTQTLLQKDASESSRERSGYDQSAGRRSRRSSSPLETLFPSLTLDRVFSSDALLSGWKRQNILLSRQSKASLQRLSGSILLHQLEPVEWQSRAGLYPIPGDGEQRFEVVGQSAELLKEKILHLHTLRTSHGHEDSASAWADHTGWSKIKSITFVRRDEFFDMWVPGYENYVAEGFINHNTGVGKGRVAAAMIRWAQLHGHLPIFITEKPTLFSDMHGDLTDIGSGNTINPLLMNADASITNRVTGEKMYRNTGAMKPVFQRIRETGAMPPGKNALFLSYSQINNANDQQLVLHRLAPNAVFILDESHNASGASATGGFVSEVLDKSKGAIFLSATWAKRPDNLPVYAGKTDISIAIPDKEKVADAIAAGGAPLQAVVTSQLAQAGQFVRRERSFDGIEIRNVVDIDSKAKHEKISDKVTEVLRAIMKADSLYHKNDFEKMQAQAKKDGKSSGSKGLSVSHMEFSSTVHNMVKQLLLALKADSSADLIIHSIEMGERPVFALENTMGAFLGNYVDGNNIAEGDSLADLTYSKISDRALMRTRYYNETDEMGNKTRVEVPLSDLSDETRAAYDAAQALIDKLEVDLPVSPIDHIRDKVEKAGHKIAEITGRDQRIDYSGALPKLSSVPGIEQKDRVNTATQFNNGKIDALIINKAAAAGISLHASEKFLDQRPRHMIVGQPAGDVNVVMQMLGRINRTGQVKLPSYTMFSAALPAEMRPAIVLAKKMKSLNANVSSNTRSATSVKAVDMFNKYGDKIVAQYLLDNPESSKLLGLEADTDNKGEASANEGLAMKATGHSALLTVKEQQVFMDSVTEAYSNYIDFLDETGQNDLEPVTYDYEARETHSQRMYQGIDPSSPFGHDAHYGEYSIKRQGKAFTPEEVHNKIADAFGPEVMKRPPFERDTLFARELAGYFEEHYNTYKETLSTAAAQDKAAAVRQKGRQLLNEYRVGSAFSLEINGDLSHGVVIGIEGSKKLSGNPYAPSSLQFTLAVNTPLRSIRVPGSQITKITLANLGRNADIDHLFRDHMGDSRQKSKIITGNLLGAYGELKAGVKGRIISFTMNDGTTRLGIQMPTKFDIDKDVSDTYAMRAPEAALEYMKKGKYAVLQSSGQEIGVFATAQGTINIRTKMSKAVSGKFFLDPRLRELVVGGDFVSSGGMMKATVKDGDELEALSVIMGKTALYAPASGVKQARKFDEAAQEGKLAPPSKAKKYLGGGEEGFANVDTLLPSFVTNKVIPYFQKAVPTTWGELSKAIGNVRKTPKAIGYEIASILYPAMLADSDARDIMGRALGEPALELFKASLFLDGIDKMFEGMPEKDWIEFVDRIQNEKPQPTPDLQHAQEMLQSVLEPQRMAEQAAANLGRKGKVRVELTNRAGYFPNRYSKAPGKGELPTGDEQMARIFSKKPFAGPQTFKKQQKYTLKNAVADGAVPLGNPVRMVLRRLQEGAKFVAAQHALWNGRQAGLIVYKSARGKMPPNFVKINDNIAKVFRPVETAEGGTMFVEGGEWVMDKDFGRIFNNYLSQDHIRNSTIGHGFVQLKTSATAFKMGMSAFHYGTMAFWSLADGLHSGLDEFYNQGVRGLDAGHLASGSKKLATFLATPITAVRGGNQIINYLKDPDGFLATKEGVKLAKDYPDLPELLRLVFAGGFRSGMNQDFPDQSPMSMGKDFAAGRLVAGTMKALPFLTRAVAYPLFNFVIPRLKLMANVQMLSQKLEQYSQAIANGDVTPETVARNVVAVNENSFGEFNYENNYWNNTVKSAVQLLFLAPGWKEGTWRGAAQAAKEIFTENYDDKFYEKVDNEGDTQDWAHKYAARLPQLGLNSGRLLSAIIVATAIATTLDKALTGKWIWEEISADMKDNGLNVLEAADLEALHPRTGKQDAHGKPVRFNLPSDLRDYEHAVMAPASYVYNSFAPWLTGIINTMRNRDWKDDYIINPADAAFTQFKQGIYYNLKQNYEPITASSYLNKSGPQDSTTKTERTLGLIGGAPKGWDVPRSVARAEELREAHDPHSPMTPEQQSEKDMLKEAPPTHGQARYALKTRNMTELEKIVMRLSYTDAKDVFEHATPDEKKALQPIMRKKQIAAFRSAHRR
jgi:hypothetical protein